LKSSNGNGLDAHPGEHISPIIRISKRLDVVLHNTQALKGTNGFTIVAPMRIDASRNETRLKTPLLTIIHIVIGSQSISDMWDSHHGSKINAVNTELINRADGRANNLRFLWPFGYERAQAIRKLIPWVSVMAMDMMIAEGVDSRGKPVDGTAQDK